MISDFTQAVILAGGRGERLRPITDNCPKPMVEVNGRPFLFYLLEQLSESGIKDFVLLTGYLGEKISDYFGNGEKWGWNITYSKGPAEWDTGRRIWEARTLFNSRFLLMYSDNFAQVKFNQLKSLHELRGLPVTLVLSPKAKGNISISEDGTILAYNNARNIPGHDYVELGYMIIERDIVLKEFHHCDGFPDFNFSFLLKKLGSSQQIAGLIVRDAYHSISDLERLSLMAEYLKPKKIILIDRDGTMNKKAPIGEYISTWANFEWIQETRDAMKNLAREGFKFIIITNQAGIARKMIDPEELEYIHKKLSEELALDGIEVLRIYFSPHHWEEDSYMRKPKPGMFFEASKDFYIRMDRCFYIGDDERDCEAAYNAGCGMIYINEHEYSSKQEKIPSPYLFHNTLQDAIPFLISTYKKWADKENC